MSEESWHDLGDLDRFESPDPQGAMVAGQRLCVGKAEKGFFAIDDTCPHAGGSLSEGMVDGEQVICPLHAFAFEVRSGHCPDDPGCSVRAYRVRVEDGVLQVQL
jgi:nitrite reductase (NADH) small subunit